MTPGRVPLPAPVTGIAVHPDGRSVGCVTSAGTVHLVDVRAGRVVWSRRHAGVLRRAHPMTTVAFSAGGDLMCTGDEKGTAVLRSTADGHRVRGVAPRGEVGALCSAFSPDGEVVVIGYRTGGIVASAVDDGRELGRVRHVAWPNAVAFDPSGAFLVSAGFDGRVHVRRADDLSEVWQLRTPGRAGEVDVAAGQVVVTGFGDRVAVLGLADGAERGALPHPGRVLAARFGPDGRVVLTETEDGVVTLWDADSLARTVEVRVGRYAAHPHLLPSGDVVAGVGDELRVFSLDAAAGPA